MGGTSKAESDCSPAEEDNAPLSALRLEAEQRHWWAAGVGCGFREGAGTNRSPTWEQYGCCSRYKRAHATSSYGARGNSTYVKNKTLLVPNGGGPPVGRPPVVARSLAPTHAKGVPFSSNVLFSSNVPSPATHKDRLRNQP